MLCTERARARARDMKKKNKGKKPRKPESTPVSYPLAPQRLPTLSPQPESESESESQLLIDRKRVVPPSHTLQQTRVILAPRARAPLRRWRWWWWWLIGE